MLYGISDMAAIARQGFGRAVPEIFPEALPPNLNLFGLPDAERLFTDDDLRRGEFSPGHEKLSLVMDQKLVPDGDYYNLTDARKLQEAGATVMFRSLQRHAPKPREVCQVFADLTNLPVHCNGYWTPPNSQGFPLHSDSDSVFALQLVGKKTWLFFSPRATRADDTENIHWIHTEGSSREAAPPETAAYKLTVYPGQVLFVPRGWGHYALTDGVESLHVSFGILHPEIGAEIIAEQHPVWPA